MSIEGNSGLSSKPNSTRFVLFVSFVEFVDRFLSSTRKIHELHEIHEPFSIVAINYLLRKCPDFDARVAVVPQSGLHIQRLKAFPKGMLVAR